MKVSSWVNNVFMKSITEGLINKIRKETDHYDEERAAKEMALFSRSQPNLLSFILEFTQDLDERAEELGVYLLFVVYNAFQKEYGRKIKKITQKELISSFEENDKLVKGLEKAHEKFFDRVAGTQLAAQPYVIKYVIDALYETDEDDEESGPLNEEDIVNLFMLIKTVIDVLTRKTDE